LYAATESPQTDLYRRSGRTPGDKSATTEAIPWRSRARCFSGITSNLWAARFRRNLLPHGTLPKALDAKRELKPYFERFKQTPEMTRGQGLELILVSWLVDLAQSGESRAPRDPSLNWLPESGLLDALRRARIEASPLQ